MFYLRKRVLRLCLFAIVDSRAIKSSLALRSERFVLENRRVSLSLVEHVSMEEVYGGKTERT